MNIAIPRSVIALTLLLSFATTSQAQGSSCEVLAAEQTRISEALSARQESLSRYQRDLDGIKAEAKAAFGDTLPSLSERNRLASLAAKELRAFEPKTGLRASAQTLQSRIDALTRQLHANQQRSVKQLAAAQAQGPGAEARFEQEVREESTRLNKELKDLYAQQQAAHDAAIADPVVYAFKKMVLRAAVRFTEVEDRQNVIDGVQKTMDEYKKRLDAVRAQRRAAECK